MGDNPTSRRYRVIQWCTGNVGARALAAILEHPRLELVGLLVTNPDKAGKDASELLPPRPPPGADQQQQHLPTGPTGVKATTSPAEVLALEADCVVYMPQGFDLGQVCDILASGKNVATPTTDLIHPVLLASAGAGAGARIEAACARGGGTSVFCTGSTPGVFPQQLPLALLAAQRRLGCLTYAETADLSTRDSPGMLFDVMGFGGPPPAGAFANEAMLQTCRGPTRGSFAVLAQALGVRLEDDDVTVEGEYGLARSDVEIAAGKVGKGTVAATRITVSGAYKGKTIFRQRFTWFVTSDVDTGGQTWDFGEGKAGMHFEVEGDAPLSVRVSFPAMSDAEYAVFTPGLTAHPVVNAVPAVCQASKAGILTILDLPPIVPALE